MSVKIDDTMAKKTMRARKEDSQDSTGSTETEIWKSPKDALALGQVIVQQLELDDRGTVLARWIAHHLAEVIADARQARGPKRAASEARAVDLVLKLWAYRRALPEPVDPLGGYRKAVEVLGRLMPEANPWERFRGSGTHEGLFREMFELLAKSVLAGVLLTQVSRIRPITEEEFKALEEEERLWHSTLEQWMPFVGRSRSRSEVETEFVHTDITENAEVYRESKRLHDSGNRDHAKDEQIEPDDVRLHAMIVSNLERMQTDLNGLLTRWRETSPDKTESTGEISEDSLRDRMATADDSLHTFRGGEKTQEKIETETTGKKAVASDQSHSFWSSLSLVELAKAQGVSPVGDLGGIAALWPSDDDPDELLDHILLERAARRRVAETSSGP